MSLRHDAYMSLCLEQARQSLLHYRHGCIIVRGGKVTGKGYNHYRPGFNGGALKNGRTASSNVRVQVKQTKKQKPKHTQASPKLLDTSSFSGGHLSNGPLSMHSEMMAICSALSLSAHDSGSSARSTALCKKPSFKLPASGNRKLRLQRLSEYADTVCEEAEHARGRIDPCSEAFVQVDNGRFEPATCGLEQVQQQCPQRTQGRGEREPEK
jgi:deoxycytidylate deaminase